METTGVMAGLNRFCIWITRFAYLNLLWVFFSLIGLFIFGFFPATAAMFTVVRKWIIGEREFSVSQTFLSSYRKDFLKTNSLGLMLLLIGSIIYINYNLLTMLEGWLAIFHIVAVITVFLMYCVTILYIFPLFVHYELATFQYIKYAVIIGIGSPILTVSMVVIISAFITGMYMLPGLIPFYFGSVLSFLLMWFAIQGFRKIDKKILS